MSSSRWSDRPRKLSAALRTMMAAHGFRRCDDAAHIARFHRLLAALIPGPVATPAALAAVEAKTRSSLFLYTSPAEVDEAFLGLFAFSPAGEKAFSGGAFCSLAPDPAHVAPPSRATRMGYVWGFGGVNARGRFRVLRALKHMRGELFSHMVLAARAASPEGRALMAPFGHAPSHTNPDLFIAPAPAESKFVSMEAQR